MHVKLGIIGLMMLLSGSVYFVFSSQIAGLLIRLGSLVKAGPPASDRRQFLTNTLRAVWCVQMLVGAAMLIASFFVPAAERVNRRVLGRSDFCRVDFCREITFLAT
jgi:Na+-driven multidrug efflux pump